MAQIVYTPYPMIMAEQSLQPLESLSENDAPEYHTFQKSYGNLVDILKCDPLYRYFISEGIITTREYEDEINCETNHVKQIKIFLGKISSSLETKYTKSFYKMLTVMSIHGNAATRDLAADIRDKLPCELKSGIFTEKEKLLPAPTVSRNLIYTEVEANQDFSAVVSDIVEKLENSVNKNIDKIKVFCYNLSSINDKERIKGCKSMYEIFDVLEPHWKWNSHRLLTIIIKRVKCPEALELLEKYKKKINYQMKIKDIYKHCEHSNLPVPSGFTRMEAIIDKDYDDISLEEFSELEEFVNEHLGIVQCPYEVNRSQSIEVIWLVPIEATDSLRLKILEHKEAFLQKSFLYLKIGDIVILNKKSQVDIEHAKAQQVLESNKMFSYLHVTSVDQFQDITSEDLKHLEDKLFIRMQDEQTKMSESNRIRSEKNKDSPVPFLNWNGTMMGFLLCLIINSYGGKYDTVEAVPLEDPILSPTETTTPVTIVENDINNIKHFIQKDPLKQLVQTLEDVPDSQNSKYYYLEAIENLFRECTKAGVLIYYTGYAEKGTGNWCFKDGTISFLEIFELYKKYLTKKLLHIFIDCCYSGQWVTDCAKCLDEMGIGACGHEIREKGLLLKINASCQPCQKATYGVFSSKGIFYDDDNDSLFIYSNKKFSKTQIAHSGDFPKIKCLQLEGPTAPCRLSDIPPRCSWKWVDLVAVDFKDRPSSLIYTVRGKVQGKEAWQYVLVERELVDKFKAQISTGVINVSLFGYVISSGWGRVPPDNIAKNIKIYSPDFVGYF